MITVNAKFYGPANDNQCSVGLIINSGHFHRVKKGKGKQNRKKEKERPS